MKTFDARRWIILLSCLGIAFAQGCSCSEEPEAPPKPKETAMPTPKPAPAPAPRTQAVAPTLEKALQTKVDLPPGYPEDAPIYPGSIANSSGTSTGRVRAIFSTPAARDKVLDWYVSELDANGWEDVTQSDFRQHKVIQAFKGSRELKIMISEAADRTLIIVSTAI